MSLQFSEVHTSKKQRLGTKKKDAAGNEYIYLSGAASIAIGSAVTFNQSYAAARTVTGARGPAAIAKAAVDATTKYGWFQIFGKGSAIFAGAAVAGARLFSASTGSVDDAVVAGDQLDNAFVGATVSGAGLGDVLLSYPVMNGNG